jgi:hypothetical protein
MSSGIVSLKVGPAIVIIMYMVLLLTMWLVLGAISVPSSTAIRRVCLRHDGVSSVIVTNPVLPHFYAVCQDGWVQRI